MGGMGRREDWIEEETEPQAVLTDAEPTMRVYMRNERAKVFLGSAPSTVLISH